MGLRPTPRFVPAHHIREGVGRGVDYPPAPQGEICREMHCIHRHYMLYHNILGFGIWSDWDTYILLIHPTSNHLTANAPQISLYYMLDVSWIHILVYNHTSNPLQHSNGTQLAPNSSKMSFTGPVRCHYAKQSNCAHSSVHCEMLFLDPLLEVPTVIYLVVGKMWCLSTQHNPHTVPFWNCAIYSEYPDSI